MTFRIASKTRRDLKVGRYAKFQQTRYWPVKVCRYFAETGGQSNAVAASRNPEF
jgi:hypothetical protein